MKTFVTETSEVKWGSVHSPSEYEKYECSVFLTQAEKARLEEAMAAEWKEQVDWFLGKEENAKYAKKLRATDPSSLFNTNDEGRIYINTKSKIQPKVVDKDKKEIDTPIMGGDKVRVAFHLQAYGVGTKTGCTPRLDAVQLIEKAPYEGGGDSGNAVDAFDDVPEESIPF